MKSIGEKIKQFFAAYNQEIVLAAAMFLISCISFAAGYLYASQTLKERPQFEGFYESSLTQ